MYSKIEFKQAYYYRGNKEIEFPDCPGIIIALYDKTKTHFGLCSFLPSLKEHLEIDNISECFIKILKKFKQLNLSPANISFSIFYLPSEVNLANQIELFFKKYSVHCDEKNLLESGVCVEKIKLYNLELVNRLVLADEPAEVNCPTKIMIVDDSKSMIAIIKKILSDFKDIEIVGTALNAVEAENLIPVAKPDVLTVDINMPIMNGAQYVDKVMHSHKTPCIIFSSLDYQSSGPVFDALANGAFDYVKKPSFDEIESVAGHLRDLIKAAHKLKIKNQKSKLSPPPLAKTNVATKTFSQNFLDSEIKVDNKIILIGSSTGGIEALDKILSKLPSKMPPIIIVQHIPAEFSLGLAQRFNAKFKLTVKEAGNEEVVNSTVYIAPGGKQLGVKKSAKGLSIEVNDDAPINRFKPSVDYLLNSIKSNTAKNILGIILTGMGSDGAKGLLAIKQMGHKTIAQDEASSIVFGMPKVAIEIGAATSIVSLDDIAEEMIKFSMI